MSTDEQMNAVLRAWREGVRGKERRTFRIEERIALRMAPVDFKVRSRDGMGDDCDIVA